MKRENRIFILSAPSRGGKDAVVRGLKEYDSLNLKHVVGYTTRKKRSRERAGQVYHFVTKERFRNMVKQGAFVEWVIHNHENYGIPKRGILSTLNAGKNVLLQINLRGAAKVKKMWPKETVTMFLMPESLSDIEKRFDSKNFTQRQIRERMKIAKREIEQANFCDYIIANRQGKLEKTIEEAVKVIKKELGVKSTLYLNPNCAVGREN
jgi:guanylate kinase